MKILTDRMIYGERMYICNSGSCTKVCLLFCYTFKGISFVLHTFRANGDAASKRRRWSHSLQHNGAQTHVLLQENHSDLARLMEAELNAACGME